MHTSPKGFIIPLLLIIIVVLLAGGGTYVYMQTKPATVSSATQATTTQSTTNIATSTAQASEPSILETTIYDGVYNNTIGSGLVFLSRSDKKDQIIIPANTVAEIASGQSLIYGRIVINPINERQIIFTTWTIDSNNPIPSGDFSFVNRIYSYDLGTNELKLLITTEDKTVANRELMILGTQSSKVIFYSHTNGRSMCGGLFWLDTPDRYTFVDMNNIGVGLRPYAVSAAQIQQAESNEIGCPGN